MALMPDDDDARAAHLAAAGEGGLATLLVLLSLPESRSLEYKRSDRVSLHRLIATLAALSSEPSGGYLIIGVDEPSSGAPSTIEQGASDEAESQRRPSLAERVVGLRSPERIRAAVEAAAEKLYVAATVELHDLFGSAVLMVRVAHTQSSTISAALFRQRRTGSREHVLVLATEWWSRHGGLSTFNRGLCEALVLAGCRVTCLVPAAEADEVTEAQAVGVVLVATTIVPGIVGPQALLRAPSSVTSIDIVIGHGRITGPQAAALKRDRFPEARRVHIVHTVAEEIEWFKDRTTEPVSTRAGARDRIERQLAASSDVVVAVGPLLTRKTKTMLRGEIAPPVVVSLIPGVVASAAAPSDPPEDTQILVLGRTEDFRLKGLDIAASAIGSLDFAPLDLGSRPTLVVRGSPPEDASALQALLAEQAGYRVPVLVRDWTVDQELLSADLARATLVLMPSRHEGFGLVAFEAISATVPVLVSDTSGIGEHLADLGRQDCIVATRGPDHHVVAAWARAIDRTLFDTRAAFRRAETLREMYATSTSWGEAATDLLTAVQSH